MYYYFFFVISGHAWPPSSILRFKELLNNRSTQLKVSYVDWSEQYVCGFIADVSDPDNVKYANEVLVNEGHALWNNQVMGDRCYDVKRAKSILIKWKLANIRQRKCLSDKILLKWNESVKIVTISEILLCHIVHVKNTLTFLLILVSKPVID